jgi:D-glycero-alpha-D-manno-heptose-7-phosphate kinase
MIKNLQFNKELGLKSKKFLEQGKLNDFAEILNEQWKCKYERSPETINPRIKFLYNLGINNGALGGKLVGAGGGGFLLFYAEDKEKLKSVMLKEDIEELRFNFDFNGVTRII